MESALDLTHLAEALGDRPKGRPRRLPTPTELQELLAEAEMHMFLRQTEIPDELIRTAWYLHGIASSNRAPELFGYPRQKRAFEISAHIFDLALNDQARTRGEKLELAFGAEMGYRRSELDPNATAIFARVESLLVREPPIEDHIESVALEAAVSLLGFQTRVLFELHKTWLRQLDAVRRQTGSEDLWSTIFGPAESVVDGCSKLLNFLALGIEEDLSLARSDFLRVVWDDRALPDVNAKWVAGLLLDFADAAERNSIWRLLPPELPAVARQAFTLTSPAVLTLWPPQRLLFQSAGGRHPLSPAARRLVFSVPTSSGKTLLAQLMIVCHLAAQDGGVCYVSPMRSLGREVRRSLRNRLRALARELGPELPDFGPFSLLSLMDQRDGALVDGSDEYGLLADFFSAGALVEVPPDVEVMTPERLAHLLRRDLEVVLDRFKLFIFDEAHFLGEEGRGFTLESILSFLHWRTTNTEHKIVLLSAALGNEGQLMTWLDPGDEGVPLSSTWRGPRRLHAVFNTRIDWDTGVVSDVRRSKDWPVRATYDLTGVLRLRPAEGADPRTLP